METNTVKELKDSIETYDPEDDEKGNFTCKSCGHVFARDAGTEMRLLTHYYLWCPECGHIVARSAGARHVWNKISFHKGAV